jgi:hypothetical protein
MSIVMAVALCAPAHAADPLKIKKHKYLYTTIGGAAFGAGIGAIAHGSGNVTKGALLGGGGASAVYLHFNHKAAGDHRPIAYFATHSALGLGAGWTVCGCGTGAVAGLLVGAGADLIWQSLSKTPSHPSTAGTNP